MKTFLLFGANGFIGSNLADYLAKNAKIVAIDTYNKKPIFRRSENIEILKVDLLKDIKKLIRLAQSSVGGVVWAVGGTVPADRVGEHKEILEILRPTIELMEIFIKKQVPLIFLSSAGMLYHPGKTALTENSEIDVWTWYGLQKLVIEKSLLMLAKEYENKNVKILRISSAYGPRQPWDREQGVVAKLFRSVIKKEPFVLYGSEIARRDYVYVEDLCRIIDGFLNQSTDYTVYNIATGRGHTIKGVRKLIEKISQNKIRLIKQTRRDVDPYHIDISSKRFFKEFSKFKFTSLEDGLLRTYDWYKGLL